MLDKQDQIFSFWVVQPLANRDPIICETILKLYKPQSSAGRPSLAELILVIPSYVSHHSPHSNQDEPGGQLSGAVLKHCHYCWAYFIFSLHPLTSHIPLQLLPPHLCQLWVWSSSQSLKCCIYQMLSYMNYNSTYMHWC